MITNGDNIENKKKIHLSKKMIFLIIIIILITYGKISSTISKNKEAKQNRSELLETTLSKYLPELKKGNVDIGSDSEEYLSFSIKDIDYDFYKEYKNSCIDLGFSIENDKDSRNYTAYNDSGYKLDLSFYDNEINVRLEVPEKMDNISWPTNGIVTILPKPKSKFGKITSDSSNYFCVKIAKTSLDDYNEYVKTCEDNGFNVDYNKTEKKYEAKNSDGDELYLSYLENGIMEIRLKEKEEEVVASEPEPEPQTEPESQPESVTEPEQNSSQTQVPEDTSSQSTTTNNNEIRSDFKSAMDSYESFMNEYVSFMKKYLASNGTDLSLLTDYSNYMTKYSKVCKDFEAWESKDLNSAELAYYIDVQARVSKKLLEIN